MIDNSFSAWHKSCKLQFANNLFDLDRFCVLQRGQKNRSQKEIFAFLFFFFFQLTAIEKL